MTRRGRSHIEVDAVVRGPAVAAATSVFKGIDYLNNGMIYAAATVLTLAGGNTLYHLYNKVHPERTIQIVRRLAGGIGMAVFVGA